MKRSCKKLLSVMLATSILSTSCQRGVLNCKKERVLKKSESIKTLKAMSNVKLTNLTAADVVEMTLNRNLDLLAQDQDLAIQRERSTHELLGMLPELRANFSQERKSRSPESSSAAGGNYEPEKTKRYDLTAGFDIITFGLSYFQHQMAKSQEEIVKQRNMRLRQTLIYKSLSSYYHALVTENAVNDINQLIDKASKVQEDAQKQVESGNISESEVLDLQKEVTRMKGRLRSFLKESRVKKGELATLMGLLPGTEISFAEGDFRNFEVDSVDVKEMEDYALVCRPELYQADIESNMSAIQRKESVLNMFPHLKVMDTFTYNDNKNYKNHHWNALGFNAAYDLLSIPRGFIGINSSKYEKSKRDKVEVARTLAILSQLHMAYQEWEEDSNHHSINRDMADICLRQKNTSEKQMERGEQTVVNVFLKECEAFIAKKTEEISLVDKFNSLINLEYVMGAPFVYTSEMIFKDGLAKYKEVSKVVEHYKNIKQQEPLLIKEIEKDELKKSSRKKSRTSNPRSRISAEEREKLKKERRERRAPSYEKKAKTRRTRWNFFKSKRSIESK